jgi:hypothetical protein
LKSVFEYLGDAHRGAGNTRTDAVDSPVVVQGDGQIEARAGGPVARGDIHGGVEDLAFRAENGRANTHAFIVAVQGGACEYLG